MKYVTQFTVKQVCDILDVKLSGKYDDIKDNTLTNISINVNSLARGGAFILSGSNQQEREEGLAKAIKKNPQFLIAGKASHKLVEAVDIPYIIVKDPYDAMVKLSGYIRKKLDLTVVGVTGSLGKTTTKEMIYSVLKQEYVADKNFGNRNNTKGIFNSLQLVDKDVQFYVQEFGVAIGKKSMESKINACLPDAAVITNISEPHLDVFGTKENILKEKVKLITEMPEGCPAFLNYDDNLLKQVKLDKHPVISFAILNKDADYYAENIQFVEDYITFDAVHEERRTAIVLHSREKHNIGNALVAMAVGEYFHVPLDKIVEGINSFRSEGIRQSLVNIGGYKLYVDCYNTAPVSLLGAIEVLEHLPVEADGKRIAVLGDIVRLGEEEKKIHKDIGEKISASKVDLVLCFGNYNAQIMARAIRSKGVAALYTDNREELNNWMRRLIRQNDVTLIKGPVARLLSKSIDQVFGTSYHVRSEHHERVRYADYQIDVIFEKEDASKTTAALLEYHGKDEVHTVLPTYNNIDIFCIAANCFKDNNRIREVFVSEPIYNISDGAFQGCCNLTTVSLPNTMKVIGNQAFKNCASIKEIFIPAGVIDIGEKAFSDCTQLEKIILPGSIGHIGTDAFDNCPNVNIYCENNSYAYNYAVENNILYTIV